MLFEVSDNLEITIANGTRNHFNTRCTQARTTVVTERRMELEVGIMRGSFRLLLDTHSQSPLCASTCAPLHVVLAYQDSGITFIYVINVL